MSSTASAWPPPDVPVGWYFAGRASSLRRGEVAARVVGATPVAVFRTERGTVHAVDAYCGHLGASLALGDVLGERLRCPLHHREYDGSGACHGGASPIASYPVHEAFSALLVHNAPSETPPPAFDAADRFVFRAGRPVRLGCSWYAAVANAFDVHHLSAVHRRELLEPPTHGRVGEKAFRLRYRSRPFGSTTADRWLRRLAPDGVSVSVTCWGGPLVLVESEAGGRRAALAVCLAPVDGGVEILPIAGVAPSRLRVADGARARLARWLYTSFLTRDAAVLEGMRLQPRPALPDDACLAECLEFLTSLEGVPPV